MTKTKTPKRPSFARRTARQRRAYERKAAQLAGLKKQDDRAKHARLTSECKAAALKFGEL